MKKLIFTLLAGAVSLCASTGDALAQKTQNNNTTQDNVISRDYIYVGITPPKIQGAEFGRFFDNMVNGSAVAIGSLEVTVSSPKVSYRDIFKAVAQEIMKIDNKYSELYTIEDVKFKVPNKSVTETLDFFFEVKLVATDGNAFERMGMIEGKFQKWYEKVYLVPVNITVKPQEIDLKAL